MRSTGSMAGEYELPNPCEVVFGLGDFNGHVGKEIEGFEGIHEGNGVREMRKEECYKSFVTKEKYEWQTRGLRRQTKKR